MGFEAHVEYWKISSIQKKTSFSYKSTIVTLNIRIFFSMKTVNSIEKERSAYWRKLECTNLRMRRKKNTLLLIFLLEVIKNNSQFLNTTLKSDLVACCRNLELTEKLSNFTSENSSERLCRIFLTLLELKFDSFWIVICSI